MGERDIFTAAREKTDPAARAAYLAEACAGDAALRKRLERLLRADETPDNLLDAPAAVLLDTVQPDTGAWTPNLEADHTPEKGSGEAFHFLAPPGQPGALGRMDHYEILELVGRGGMGLVLKAFDTRLHRIVAIKVMAPNLAVNATAPKRFVREAQAGAAVNHKNVVTIHAVEAQHSPPYLVMEFVAGRSLEDKLRREGPPEVKEIVRIGSEIAGGLAAAHACGLIHRDIKPANILLEHKTERVKITDFGLARAANDARLTQSGMVAGTPKYMSPEQALGQPLDSRSNLGLHYTPVTDANLAHFKHWKDLNHLGLNGTRVTDAGLAHLEDCKQLTFLDVRGTRLSAKRIEQFHQAHPRCKIEHDGGTFEPTK